MLWALLFSLILSNDPAFIFPNLEKQVKKHITDKERKKEIIELRKVSEKGRKKYLKEKEKILKDFNKLILSRTTTNDEFTAIYSLKAKARKQILDSEIQRIIKMQELIRYEEWIIFLENNKNNNDKHAKERKKQEKALEKLYYNTLKRVKHDYQNPLAEEKIISIIGSIHAASKEYISTYYMYIENLKTNISKDSFSIEAMNSDIERVILANDNIVKLIIDSHHQIKELTSSKEWNRVIRHIASFKI